MKTLYNLLFALLLPATMIAGSIDDGKFTKQKRINKAYKVNEDAGIDIDNQFGPVFVTTWDEDKIELDIVIKVSGNNEDWVDRRLAAIDVEINAMTNLVSAKTRIKNVSGRSSGSSMEISYTLKIPRKGAMDISNKYGDVISTDINGPVKLNVQYGNLKVSRLNNASNLFNLQYCGTVNVEKIKAGNIRADYSKLHIGSFDSMFIESNYTDVHASEGGNVQFSSDYGKLSFEKVGNVDGKGNYVTVNASRVSGNLSMRGDYSTVRVDNLGAPGGNVSISGNYNTVSIDYASDYAFDFEVRGKYTNVKLGDDLEVTTRIDTHKEKTFKGHHLKSGARKVVIDGEYGNVSLKR